MFSFKQDDDHNIRDDFLPENPSTFSITYNYNYDYNYNYNKPAPDQFINIPQNLGFTHPAASFDPLKLVEGTTLNKSTNYGTVHKDKRKCKSFSECPKDGLQKKIIHKFVEKQRREEMAKLYGSLRSVIPHDLLKGKRSISDHVEEAANYIRHLQNDVNELQNKRDRLKKYPCSNNPKASSSTSLPVHVIVNSCNVGIEVSIFGDSPMERFPFSNVLNMLQDEGLNVISSICTNVEDMPHYTIQSEVMEFPGVIDLHMLQRKLCHAINQWMNIV